LLSRPELRLSAESDQELTYARSQANVRFADIHPEICRSGSSNEAAIPECWVSTSQPRQALVVFMDDTHDDRKALAEMLLMESGRLMEDTSPEFALALPDHNTIAARIELLERIGSDLRAFAAAARALFSYPGPDHNNFT
jgi:hypothetical protein